MHSDFDWYTSLSQGDQAVWTFWMYHCACTECQGIQKTSLSSNLKAIKYANSFSYVHHKYALLTPNYSCNFSPVLAPFMTILIHNHKFIVQCWRFDKNEEWFWKHYKEWHFDSSKIETDIKTKADHKNGSKTDDTFSGSECWCLLVRLMIRNNRKCKDAENSGGLICLNLDQWCIICSW